MISVPLSLIIHRHQNMLGMYRVVYVGVDAAVDNFVVVIVIVNKNMVYLMMLLFWPSHSSSLVYKHFGIQLDFTQFFHSPPPMFFNLSSHFTTCLIAFISLYRSSDFRVGLHFKF